MFRINLLIIFFYLASCSSTNATIYYVANSGNDENDGITEASPWRTISKVNNKIFSSGDKILFKCGDVWREQLTIPSSGTKGMHIIFGNYGKGDRPLIIGSNSTSWTNYSGNVWESDLIFDSPYQEPYNGGVFFVKSDGSVTWGLSNILTGMKAISDLKKEYEWTWISNHIYIYSPSDPNREYSSVEISQRDNCIYLNNKNYLTIDGLDIRYSKLAGIKEAWPYSGEVGLVITDCNVSYIGIKGSSVGYGIEMWHGDANINFNTIHECGRRGISSHVQDASPGDRLSNVTFEFNTIYNCYHAHLGIVCDVDGASYENVYVRYNILYNDLTQTTIAPEGYTSGLIAITGTNAGEFDTFNNVNVYGNVCVNSNYNSIQLNSCENVNIYNNTIYGVNPTSTAFSGMFYMSGSIEHVDIKNNIIYNNTDHSINAYHPCIYAAYGPNYPSMDVDYNLYYNTDVNEGYFNLQGHGAYYHLNDTAAYKKESGWDANSLLGIDPLVISEFNLNLQDDSPAIARGLYLGSFKDINGKDFCNPPSIGAYENGICGAEEPAPSGFTVKLYPNPTASKFTILTDKKLIAGNFDVRIFNSNGIKVFEDFVKIDNTSNDISVESFASGIYLVCLMKDGLPIAVQKLSVKKTH